MLSTPPGTAVYPLPLSTQPGRGVVKYLEIPSAQSDDLLTDVDTALKTFLSGSFVEWLFVVTWTNVQPSATVSHIVSREVVLSFGKNVIYICHSIPRIVIEITISP